MNPADSNESWEGQATLSRLPIVGDAQLWRLETSGPKRRRALVVSVETSLGRVDIVNTDHEMSFLDPTQGSRKQVTGLISHLRRHEAPLMVVGGDFNSAGNAFRMQTSTRDVNRIVDAMAAADFKPLPARADAEAAPTYKFLFAGVQLDHLFSRGLECTDWDSPITAGSDHRAVWARYEVKQ
jgi:endonuclease/exonuclease/phosphatase (EEP) superfamily protein YafD